MIKNLKELKKEDEVEQNYLNTKYNMLKAERSKIADLFFNENKHEVISLIESEIKKYKNCNSCVIEPGFILRNLILNFINSNDDVKKLNQHDINSINWYVSRLCELIAIELNNGYNYIYISEPIVGVNKIMIIFSKSKILYNIYLLENKICATFKSLFR